MSRLRRPVASVPALSTWLSVIFFMGMLSAPVIPAQTPSPEPASSSTAAGNRSEPEANNGQKRQEASEGTEAFRHSPSVIKLGSMVGLSPAAASSVFEWLNFLVLAAAVLYGLFKALPRVFHGRSESIQKDIVEARVATEQANTRLSAIEERLSRLDGEIAAIRSESERDAVAEEERVKQQITEETQRILAAADQEIAAASSQAERSLRAYAADLAVDRAASNLVISTDDDRVLIQNFAGKLTEGSRN